MGTAVCFGGSYPHAWHWICAIVRRQSVTAGASASGACGSNWIDMANQFPRRESTGGNISPNLAAGGRSQIAQRSTSGCELETGETSRNVGTRSRKVEGAREAVRRRLAPPECGNVGNKRASSCRAVLAAILYFKNAQWVTNSSRSRRLLHETESDRLR